MAGNDISKASGNDGSWFLEAVGAVPASPTPSETIAALELDNTVMDMVPTKAASSAVPVMEAFDGSTGTSTSTYDPPPSVSVGGTPGATASADHALPLAAPQADDAELSSVLRSRRPFRWPAMAFGIFVVVVAALAAFWLPAALKQDARAVKQSYSDAALVLRRELPSAQTTLDTVTDPSTSSDDLSAAAPAISTLDSASHELSRVAVADLPRQMPLFPIEEITDLHPLRDTAQIAAAQGSDVARRIGHAYVYRTTIPGLLAANDLPTSADVQTINALSVALASSLVDASSALGDLPTTEATFELNELAHASVSRYATWQEDYLDTLSEGDESGAALLVAELVTLRDSLDATLRAALADLRMDIDQQIVELAADLDSYLAILNQ